jgi:hypothetical protein
MYIHSGTTTIVTELHYSRKYIKFKLEKALKACRFLCFNSTTRFANVLKIERENIYAI